MKSCCSAILCLSTVSLLSRKRTAGAAKTYLRKAMRAHKRWPHTVTLDGYAASHRAVREFSEHPPGRPITIRSSKYLNNVDSDAWLTRPDRTPCGQPVTVAEAHALIELSSEPGLSQNGLAARLQLEKSSCTAGRRAQSPCRSLSRRNPADSHTIVITLKGPIAVEPPTDRG